MARLRHRRRCTRKAAKFGMQRWSPCRGSATSPALPRPTKPPKVWAFAAHAPHIVPLRAFLALRCSGFEHWCHGIDMRGLTSMKHGNATFSMLESVQTERTKISARSYGTRSSSPSSRIRIPAPCVYRHVVVSIVVPCCTPVRPWD